MKDNLGYFNVSENQSSESALTSVVVPLTVRVGLCGSVAKKVAFANVVVLLTFVCVGVYAYLVWVRG